MNASALHSFKVSQEYTIVYYHHKMCFDDGGDMMKSYGVFFSYEHVFPRDREAVLLYSKIFKINIKYRCLRTEYCILGRPSWNLNIR